MSEMMKRRTFLKTAGAVAAALAASGVLTACGGDAPAPAPAPAPSTGGTSTDIVMGDFTKTGYSGFTFKRAYQSSAKDVPVPAWGASFLINTEKGFTFTRENFSIKADGKELTSYLGIWNRVESSENQNRITVTDTLTVEPGKTNVQISVYFRVTEEQFQNGGNIEATIQNDGKKYTIKGKAYHGVD